MNDLTKLKVGYPVYTAEGETGRITRQIDPDANEYPVRIKFGTVEADFSKDGRCLKNLPISFYAQPQKLAQTGVCDFSKYKVGDPVYLSDSRRVFVTDTKEGYLSADVYLNMPDNGRDNTGRQVFYHAPPRLEPTDPKAFEVPEHIAKREKPVDWTKVPIDTLVETDNACFRNRGYFAGLSEDGKPQVWSCGATSETTVLKFTPDEVRLI